MTEMKGIKGEHLCSICKLGKESDTVTCKDIISHAGDWNCDDS